MPTLTQSPKFGCTILGSGSSGNASVIHGPKGNLLLINSSFIVSIALSIFGSLVTK